jgi:tetratricopeptide (TPR) repeat protein
MAENKLAEAEQADGEALAIRRRLFGNDNADTATSLNDLSSVYRQEAKLTAAEPMAREALGIRQKLFGHEHLQVADSLRNLCIILGDEGRWAESEELAREVLAIRRKLLGPEHPWIAYALDDVAWAAGARGKLDEAETLERESLAMRQKLLGAEHPDVAKSLYLVGDRMRQRGNLDEAYSILVAALSIQRKLLGEDNQASMDTLHSLRMTLVANGKFAEAEQMCREELALLRKRGEADSPQVVAEIESLTEILVAQKKFSDAEQLLNETLTPAFIKQSASAELLSLRVDLKARRGQWQEAVADEALACEHEPSNQWRFPIFAALLVQTHNQPAYEQFCKRLLATYAGTTNIYVADQVAKSCLFLPSSEVDLNRVSRLADITVTNGVADQGATPYFQDCKALCEYRQGNYAEALEWAEKPLKISGLHVYGHAYAVMAMAYWRLGEKEDARAMLAKGDALAPATMPADIAEDPSKAWQGWLYARIQLDEATALIEAPVVTQGK